MVKAKKFVYHQQFEGLPKETDLKLVEEELPPIKNGEFLAEAVYLSVDPHMRGNAPLVPLGSTFIGSQVAKIIESKNPRYPTGQHVVGEFGWRTHTISDGTATKTVYPSAPWLVPDFGELPLSLSLGILGMPGNTAYFGFLELCEPKAGETVVVTGAAGAVGSIVGQMAKMRGCNVVGIAGSDAKGKWLVEELKFDHFINYKDKDFEQKFTEATPNGVDCFFENVGGPISDIILSKMNLFGRVSICGVISEYDGTSIKANPIQRLILGKQLRIQGFIVFRWRDRWLEGINQNKKWIKEGKLKYQETVTEGFENMPKAFIDMLQGGNIGKAVVKV